MTNLPTILTIAFTISLIANVCFCIAWRQAEKRCVNLTRLVHRWMPRKKIVVSRVTCQDRTIHERN